jgi:hypothetical protein
MGLGCASSLARIIKLVAWSIQCRGCPSLLMKATVFSGDVKKNSQLRPGAIQSDV